MFYSVAAYKYVKDQFPGLPSTETVRRWSRKFNFRPGINAIVLESVKSETDKNIEENNIEYQFSTQFDEINLKERIDNDGKTS